MLTGSTPEIWVYPCCEEWAWKKRIMRGDSVISIIDFSEEQLDFSVLFIPSYSVGAKGPLWLLGFLQFSSVQSLSRVWLFATPWIAARQTSLSITNSRSFPFLRGRENMSSFPCGVERTSLERKEGRTSFRVMCDTDLAIYQCENIFVCLYAQLLNHVRLFATPVACQAPLYMGLSWQEYWNGLPFSPPGHLPGPGIKPASPEGPALSGRVFTTEPPGKPKSIFANL